MTTATANAPAGTKGRKITVTHDDGRVDTFGRKNGNFVAIVRVIESGQDKVDAVSATRNGAAALANQTVRLLYGYADVRVVEIVEVTA